MLSVTDVVKELEGNGLTPVEIVELSKDLTHFVAIKQKIAGQLDGVLDKDALDEVLETLEAASFHDEFMAQVFTFLSPREKQCYLMNTLENKSFGKIAKELGLSKGRVQQSIERARAKIEKLKNAA